MKYCINCGEKIEDDVEKCGICGVDQKGIVLKVDDEAKRARINVLAVIGFAASTLSTLFLAATILLMVINPNIASVLYGVVGIIAYFIAGVASLFLSIGGLVWASVAKERGKWFAIVGIILIVAGAVSVAVMYAL